jgi:hypothetical protein
VWRLLYGQNFWEFSLRVISWARRRMPAELLPELQARERDFLLRVRIDDFAGMLLTRDPATARSLARGILP